jgi:hypothetical protein
MEWSSADQRVVTGRMSAAFLAFEIIKTGSLVMNQSTFILALSTREVIRDFSHETFSDPTCDKATLCFETSSSFPKLK